MRTLLFAIPIIINCFYSVAAQAKYEPIKTERVYLHTDRNIYIAGDNLFYTLYSGSRGSQMSKYAYLVLRNRSSMPITQVRMEIRNQTSFGNIYLPDTLHSDLYQLVCYTNNMRNEGQGSYFTKEIVIINRFDKKFELFDSTSNSVPATTSHSQYPVSNTGDGNLVIHLDKNEFNPREKVTFSLETKGITENPVTRLSVSVSEIVHGMPFEPSISSVFSKDLADREGQKQNSSIFHSEIKGSEIQGRIIPVQQSGNPSAINSKNVETNITTSTILVSTPDSIVNMQYATTDSAGSFRILLNPYYEGKELIIRLKENANAVIELDNKFNLIQPYTPSGQFRVPGIRSYLARCLSISGINRYYDIKAAAITEKKIESVTAIPSIYYKPYYSVIPSDYTPLPDFIEISRELLPAFKVRKNNNSYYLSITNSTNAGLFHIEPTIFLDGVPIDDVNQIINLDTKSIKHIETLPVIRYYGEMSFSGILAVFSKNLEINNIQFKTPYIRYQALSSQRWTKPEYYLPANIDKHIPDLRQVLLWDPEIILRNKEEQKVEFYTSDLKSSFLISIQGITSNGIPVTGSAVITVKSK